MNFVRIIFGVLDTQKPTYKFLELTNRSEILNIPEPLWQVDALESMPVTSLPFSYYPTPVPEAWENNVDLYSKELGDYTAQGTSKSLANFKVLFKCLIFKEVL